MSGQTLRLRQSIAKLLLTECPQVAKLALDGEYRLGGKAIRRGSLVDQLVFGGAQYEVVNATLKSGPRKGQPAADWRSSEAQKMKEDIEARGWVAVLANELEEAQDIAGRIRAELILAGIDIGRAELQRQFQWTTSLGIEAEGTPDAVLDTGKWVHTLDLKVGEDCNPDRLDNQVDSMMWDMQGFAYQEAVSKTYRHSGKHWLIRVDARTKLVGIYPLSEGYMQLGQCKWNAAQRIWSECRSTNEWPAYKQRAITPTQSVMRRAAERGYATGDVT